MTSGRVLARNTALNLASQIIPMGVAFIAVRVLVHALGPDRFGILALAWVLIGYFTLLDFGLGRALTQAASQALGTGDSHRLRELGVLSIAAMVTLGIVGGIIAAALTPWLANSRLEMDAALRPEAARAFYVLAVSLPVVLGTIGLRGLLEAHQHFGLATALRLPLAIFNFVGPMLVLPFSHSLVPIVAVLVGGRFVMFLAHLVACIRRYPWLIQGAPLTGFSTLWDLLRDGGWMMVSNVISPLMMYLDRFIIGALMSMAAVAYYATPFELVTKLLFLPAAVVGVFFPAFAATYIKDSDRTVMMFDRAGRLILIGVFPAVLVFVAYAREILLFWLGPEYAASTTIMQLLAIGVLVNSIAQVPVAYLQAIRRADLTAKLHLIELPLYIGMIALLGKSFGVTGVALAWTLRVSIDTVALCWMSRRQLGALIPGIDRMLVWLGGTTVALLLTTVPAALPARIALGGVVLVSFTLLAWKTLLSPAERQFALSTLRWGPRAVRLESSGD